MINNQHIPGGKQKPVAWIDNDKATLSNKENLVLTPGQPLPGTEPSVPIWSKTPLADALPQADDQATIRAWLPLPLDLNDGGLNEGWEWGQDYFRGRSGGQNSGDLAFVVSLPTADRDEFTAHIGSDLDTWIDYNTPEHTGGNKGLMAASFGPGMLLNGRGQDITGASLFSIGERTRDVAALGSFGSASGFVWGLDPGNPEHVILYALLNGVVQWSLDNIMSPGSAGTVDLGGWVVNDTDTGLRTPSNRAGMLSSDPGSGASLPLLLNSGSNDPVVWYAGGSIPDQAPYRIYQSGKAVIPNLQVTGTITAIDIIAPYQVQTISWAAVFVLTNGNCYVEVDASHGPVTVVLPDALLNAGLPVGVKKVDTTANTVTISAINGQTIDAAADFLILSQYQAVTIISDGFIWGIWVNY